MHASFCLPFVVYFSSTINYIIDTEWWAKTTPLVSNSKLGSSVILHHKENTEFCLFQSWTSDWIELCTPAFSYDVAILSSHEYLQSYFSSHSMSLFVQFCKNTRVSSHYKTVSLKRNIFPKWFGWSCTRMFTCNSNRTTETCLLTMATASALQLTLVCMKGLEDWSSILSVALASTPHCHQSRELLLLKSLYLSLFHP